MPDIYSFKAVQIIPATLEEAWDFFCTPSNLLKITPAHLNFKVINKPVEEKIYAGQIIEYKLQPVRGISVYWMTEITQVKENEYFIDEQRKGPFSLWSHRHDFRYINGSVEMTIQYSIKYL